MRTQKGFTLIELVVVIVILGILAAVAAPKFIDISSDARIATLKGVQGAIKGGNSLLLSKATIEGTEKLSYTERGTATGVAQDIEGINVSFGEATAEAQEIADLLDLGTLGTVDPVTDIAGDWHITENSGVVEVRPADVASDAACFLEYTEAADADTKATVVVSATNTSEC